MKLRVARKILKNRDRLRYTKGQIARADARLHAALERRFHRILIPHISRRVGSGPGLEFVDWQKRLDLPSPEDLIQGR